MKLRSTWLAIAAFLALAGCKKSSGSGGSPSPTFSFGSVSYTMGEDDGTVTISVERVGSAAAEVTLSVIGGTRHGVAKACYSKGGSLRLERTM